MSGFEAAGLALAILPLIFSAAKRYDSVLSPFFRYKRFAKEAKTYSKELGIQRTIFRNECRNLLEEVIDHEAASSMLDSLSQETWSDAHIDAQLVQQLGESWQACTAIIELIEERLLDVEVENQGFGAIVDQERQATPKPRRPKDWRQNVGKKLCFSFSKSRLDRNIATLRSHNDDLRTLLSQTQQLNPTATRNPSKPSRDTCDEIQKYQAIGEASRRVYEALGKACNKHTEHLAHFRVQAEQVVWSGDSAPQIKFNVGFTHLTLTGATGSREPVWFVVDSTINEHTATFCSDQFAGLDELGKTLKRQFEPAAVHHSKKGKKRVRFQTSDSAPSPGLPPTMAPDAFASQNCKKRDFCDDLRRRCREPRKPDVCIGVLEITDKCKHYVYPSLTAAHCQSSKGTSLGQLIRSKSKPRLVGGIPIHERIGLAKSLAIAVLQYHATPWLSLSWRSEDILFFGVDEMTQLPELPNLSAPHLNAKVKMPDGQLSLASTCSPHIARNPILFSLGVVLLEIAHAASLESLQHSSDLTNGQEDQYTEFFTARRLAKCKNSVMGIKYHKIVEQLVECVFPCGDDLKSDQLQAAFLKDVICPLAELEEGLRKVHLAD